MSRAQQVAGVIERRILDGTYAVGDRLPTEPELANEFTASRTTIRTAVGGLEARGMVSREQGRGTFVRSAGRVSINMLLEANLSVTDVIRSSGREPGTTGLSVDREPLPETVSTALRVPGGSPGVVVRRTRTADDVPIADSADYLLGARGLPGEVAAYETSIYALLEEVHRRPVTSGLARIEAGLARGRTARRLDIPAGAPVLVLSQVHELADGTAVMYSVVSMRSDVVNLYVHRGQAAGESTAGAGPSPGTT